MKGRGIDFEHRFKTSRWAEDLLILSFAKRNDFLAVRFGLSEIRPAEELIYGSSRYKEPDLLIYLRSTLRTEEVQVLEGEDALVRQERTRFDRGGDLHWCMDKALAAIEVEFSPYRAREMTGRHWKPKTREEWNRRPLMHANPPSAPNIWVKQEDLEKLLAWESDYRVPIVVVHIFDQEAFSTALSTIEAFDSEYDKHPADQKMLQVTTGIFKKLQSYDRVDSQGAREQKLVYVVTPSAAIKVGDVEDVKVETQLGISASRKYVSHTLFSGGDLTVSSEFLNYLKSSSAARISRHWQPGSDTDG
jgi:hypothetical protein